MNPDPELSSLFLFPPPPQVKSIQELGELLTKLNRVQPGIGEHFVDHELMEQK